MATQVPASEVRASCYPNGTVLCPVPILPFLGNRVRVILKYSSPVRLPSRHWNFSFDAAVD